MTLQLHETPKGLSRIWHLVGVQEVKAVYPNASLTGWRGNWRIVDEETGAVLAYSNGTSRDAWAKAWQRIYGEDD